VAIAGDDHHYARYEETGPDPGRRRQKLTSGGGGAALSATHHLDEKLKLRRLIPPPPDEAPEREYRLAATYPTKRESGLLPFWTPLRLPWRNLWFPPAVFLIYLAPAILMQTPVRRVLGTEDEAGTARLWEAIATSKWILYASLLVVPALIGFAAGKWVRVPLGAAHGALHVLLLSFCVALAGNVLGERLARGLDLAVAALGSLFAFVPGAVLVGLYLLLCDLFVKAAERHSGEAFAAQRIEHRKNFLRLHIGEDGRLEIYPIGIDSVPRASELTERLRTEGAPEDPWFEVPDADSRARLLERPVGFG
jgi:hypothetical protein